MKYAVEDEAVDISIADGEFSVFTAASGAADTNISFGNAKLKVEADGTVAFGVYSAIAAETVTGYLTVKDRNGNSRKLAIVS